MSELLDSAPASSVPSRSDRWTALLLAARDGQPAAFDELLQEARPAILKRARQRLQEDALADDVASRTFVKAWRNLAGYDPDKANAGAWLYKIADHLIIDALKKRRQLQCREVMGFESLPCPTGDDCDGPVRLEPEDDVEMAPPEEIEQPLLAALVVEAMKSLSESDREILKLCYFEQLSYQEIAGRLGITQQAVGPRLTRARQRLVETLPPEAMP